MTRYIVFSSYKGGVGRTTTAASMASILVRCGMDVLLVDLDIAAPGLPSLFGKPVWERDLAPADKDKGVVPWVVAGSRPETLEDSLDDIPADGGRLRLLRAGAPGKDYVGAIVHRRWSAQFERSLKAGGPPPPFARDLPDAVRQLDPRPDVVLIDSQAGLGPVPGTLFELDEVELVVFLVGDGGSSSLLEMVEDRPDMRPSSIVPAIVLMDRPGVAGGPADDRIFPPRPDYEYIPMPSDFQGLSLPSVAPLRAETSKKWATVATAHVQVAMRFFPDLAVSKSEDPELADLLKEARRRTKTALKYFISSNGEIINPSDRSRNVAFKVDTIEGILDRIYAGVLDDAVSTGRERTDEERIDSVNRAFFHGGYDAGAEFGKYLASEWSSNAADDVLIRLTTWAVFDTEVGFGHIEIEDDGERFLIQIRNPFLHGRPRRVLEGYVRGVLDHIVEGHAIEQVSGDDGPLVVEVGHRP